MTAAARGFQQVLDGRALEGLRTIEGSMGTEPPTEWRPLFLKAVDHVSHHGNGPSASPDEPLRRALAKAIGLLPSDWELLCLRGKILAGRSDFAAARADFDKAVALAPASPKPLADRAYLFSHLGDWNGALADLDRATALSTGDPRLAFERGLVLLSLGRAAEARRDLEKAAAGGMRDAEVEFQLGRALLVEGKAREALAHIQAALKPEGQPPPRKRFFQLMEGVAIATEHIERSGRASTAPGERFMEDAKKNTAQKGKGCLWLFGVGIDRPYEVTLNTLIALKRCDVVYTQTDTREIRELLEAVFPGVRSIATSSRGDDQQDAVWKAVRAELDRGSQTGYVTYGHPMLFGEGNLLARRCKKAGYPYHATTAPSSIDGILTMLQEDLDICEKGFTVQNARSFVNAKTAGDPTKGSIIMSINNLFEEGTFREFCTRLEAAFPSNHPLFALKCGDGYREETRLRLTVAEFRRKERELDPELTLFLPQLKNSPEPAPRRRPAKRSRTS